MYAWTQPTKVTTGWSIVGDGNIRIDNTHVSLCRTAHKTQHTDITAWTRSCLQRNPITLKQTCSDHTHIYVHVSLSRSEHETLTTRKRAHPHTDASLPLYWNMTQRIDTTSTQRCLRPARWKLRDCWGKPISRTTKPFAGDTALSGTKRRTERPTRYDMVRYNTGLLAHKKPFRTKIGLNVKKKISSDIENSVSRTLC